jgi:hypothetical protein
MFCQGATQYFKPALSVKQSTVIKTAFLIVPEGT